MNGEDGLTEPPLRCKGRRERGRRRRIHYKFYQNFCYWKIVSFVNLATLKLRKQLTTTFLDGRRNIGRPRKRWKDQLSP